MECKFSEVKHINKDLLMKTWLLLYKINDDQLILHTDDTGICLMRELSDGNYLEIYPYPDEVIWKVFDNRTELIKTKTFNW
jgi:hypothetical protein